MNEFSWVYYHHRPQSVLKCKGSGFAPEGNHRKMCFGVRSQCIDINKFDNWFQRKENLGWNMIQNMFIVIEIDENLLPLKKTVIDYLFV